MKVAQAILFVALATMVASRDLKQLFIEFDVCPEEVVVACCEGFDFGKITQLASGKAWPEETECEVVLSEPEPIGIRPLDKPLKRKDDFKSYAGIEVEETFVDLVATTDWDLFKYDPPNNVWSAGEGEFCLCPTPGVQPAIPSTISPVPVLDEEEDEPATVPVVGDTITSETELEGEEIEAIEAADGP